MSQTENFDIFHAEHSGLKDKKNVREL